MQRVLKAAVATAFVIAGATTQVLAQTPAAAPIVPAPTKPYTAAVVAPADIELVRSHDFPISIAVNKPDAASPGLRIKIITSAGRIKTLDGKMSAGSDFEPDRPIEAASFVISLTAAPAEPSIRIAVMSAENEARLLATTEVRVRRPRTLEFLDLPKFIKADGKTAGQLSIKIKDQLGGPVTQLPLLLRIAGRSQDDPGQIIPGCTNADGRAVFAIPASTEPGDVMMQIYGQGLLTPAMVTRQFPIFYKNEKHPYPVRNMDEWWKKPTTLD